MDISRFLMGSLVVGSLENKVSKYQVVAYDRAVHVPGSLVAVHRTFHLLIPVSS